MLSALSLLAGAAIGTGGCGAMAEPDPQPLTKDALRLGTVLARGCLPYLLGQKTEREAMRGAALNHVHPLPFGLEPGDSAPFWTSGWPGSLRVNVSERTCNVVLRGRDAAAYRAATQRAVDLAS